MTNSRHIAAPMRAPRRRTTADKIISAGLATAACAGLVGMIGVRTIEQSAAAQNTGSTASDAARRAPTCAAVTSSSGLTQADLDAYAAQLQAEQRQARRLPRQAGQGGQAAHGRADGQTACRDVGRACPACRRPATSKPVAKPVAKPAPKPVAAPAAKPKSKTKSS